MFFLSKYKWWSMETFVFLYVVFQNARSPLNDLLGKWNTEDFSYFNSVGWYCQRIKNLNQTQFKFFFFIFFFFPGFFGGWIFLWHIRGLISLILCLTVCDFVWLCVTVCDCVCLCVTVCACVTQSVPSVLRRSLLFIKNSGVAQQRKDKTSNKLSCCVIII